MSGSAASLARAPRVGVPLRLLSDDRLARMVAAGETRAFAQLHERHAGALYRYGRSIVRHDQDAQDVLQTTMARALSALSKGVPDAPLRPWLFRIAHNEAISLVRARRDTTELDDAATVAGPSVEGRAEERQRLAQLVEDLADLPERQRAALVMRELSGLSHEEIATALDVSVSGAKQAIFEARVGLGEFAKGRAMDCGDVQRLISDADGRTLRGRTVRAHLRSCAGCRALRDAIGARRTDLAALAPPLPAAAGAGILAKLLGGGGSGGAGGAGGGGTGVVAAAGGKAATAALGTKLAIGAAVVAVGSAVAPVVVTQVEHHADTPAGGTAATHAGGQASFAASVAAAGTGSRHATVALGDRPASGRRAPGSSTAADGATGKPAAAPAKSQGRPVRAHRHTSHTRSRRPSSPPGKAHSNRPAAPRGQTHSQRPASPPGQAHSAAPAHPAKPVRPAQPVKVAPVPAPHTPAKPVKPVKVAPVTTSPERPATAGAPATPSAPAPVAGGGTPPGQTKKPGG